MAYLKDDSSFELQLKLGVEATKRVMDVLNQKNHHTIVLERGALSSRRWKHKKKRSRLPDLLCVDCGRRIESRGKKSLEISMSHSSDRAWDEGADDSDLVAITTCELTSQQEWDASKHVHIVSYGELREQVGKVKTKTGMDSEQRYIWPTTVPSATGTVADIDTEDKRIRISRESDGYTLSYGLERKIDDGKNVELVPFIDEGEKVTGGEQIIAAPMDFTRTSRTCDGTLEASDWEEYLGDDNHVDTHASLKSLRTYPTGQVDTTRIREFMERTEDSFLQMEAAGTLAVHDSTAGWEHLDSILRTFNPDNPSENASKRIETILILGEIGGKSALSRLVTILQNKDELPELRSEAAHMIGDLDLECATRPLIDAVDMGPDRVRFDSISSLYRMSEVDLQTLLNELIHGTDNSRLGVALVVGLRDDVSLMKDMIGENCIPDEVKSAIAISVGIALSDTKSPEFSEMIDESSHSGAKAIHQFITTWASDAYSICR